MIVLSDWFRMSRLVMFISSCIIMPVLLDQRCSIKLAHIEDWLGYEYVFMFHRRRILLVIIHESISAPAYTVWMLLIVYLLLFYCSSWHCVTIVHLILKSGLGLFVSGIKLALKEKCLRFSLLALSLLHLIELLVWRSHNFMCFYHLRVCGLLLFWVLCLRWLLILLLE